MKLYIKFSIKIRSESRPAKEAQEYIQIYHTIGDRSGFIRS
jgi:hypothetical protein